MAIITVNNFDLSKLDLLDSNALEDPAILPVLEAAVDFVEYDTEPKAAREFYDKVLSLVREYRNNGGQNATINKKLNNVLWNLFWKSIMTFDIEIVLKALGTKLITGLKSHANIKENILKRLSLYEYGVGVDEDTRNQLIKSLESNSELLGNKKIKLVGEETNPTIGNWLRDYNAFTFSVAKRGGYEKVNYINSAPNVKILSVEERHILREAISLYDWLRYPSDIQMPKAQYKPEEAQPEREMSKMPVEQLESEPVKTPVINNPPQPKPRPQTRPPLVKEGREGPAKLREVPRQRVESSSALEDALTRAKIRVEAGLEIPSDQAEDIIHLIKQKKQ